MKAVNKGGSFATGRENRTYLSIRSAQDFLLKKVSSLYKEGVFPSIIGTDCELALINALDVTLELKEAKNLYFNTIKSEKRSTGISF